MESKLYTKDHGMVLSKVCMYYLWYLASSTGLSPPLELMLYAKMIKGLLR